MSLLLAGTIPSTDLELITGAAMLADGKLFIDGTAVPVNRGSAAMIGAACATASLLGDPAPRCVIGGDIGKRSGSRNVYRYLIRELPRLDASILCLHYIIPDIALHNQMLTAVRKMPHKPLLVADAGFMYAAKASGYASFYDLFLPDLGELAFLADDKAMHPAYTRGFLTRLEEKPAELIAQAFAGRNAAAHVCVKGRTDYICTGGKIIDEISSPVIEELEPIGGTGDTITGMVAGLALHGYNLPEACRIACSANRLAGRMARPTPATQIQEIIARIPAALEQLMHSPVR
jgi:ADP-dependent NAD(P)H-hydrate dehydratase / NAD(P)H-hydrate epimerase